VARPQARGLARLGHIQTGLVPTKRYQVRVRARLGPCRCGFANDSDYSYIKCAEEGEGYGCMWTPWSPPSASVTPMS